MAHPHKEGDVQVREPRRSDGVKTAQLAGPQLQGSGKFSSENPRSSDTQFPTSVNVSTTAELSPVLALEEKIKNIFGAGK